MINQSKNLLTLTRLGIGHPVNTIIQSIDWPAIKNIADQQGLSAIVLDGIERLLQECSPPLKLKLQWIGEVLQEYEARYQAYQKAIRDLACFYNSHGFKMMILKGYTCSLDWPKPEHRPCGDIDIWQFGKQKEADEALRQAQGPGFKIDKSHHHHTVFNWGEFTVENHYDFINVYHHRSNVELEKIFKELGQDDSHYFEVYGQKVYLPSPNLHALFLIKHMVSHFAATEINLRHVLDWAFFVEKHHEEVDWNWLHGLLEKYHMKEFFNIINAICVEDFGFDSEIFPQIQFSPSTKNKVLSDIINPAFPNEKSKKVLSRVIWKYHRWKANEWKHQLCYNESMSSAFWSGVWGHLLKPASI